MASRNNCSTGRRHYYSKLAGAITVGFVLLAPENLAASSTESQWALRYLRAEDSWKVSKGLGVNVAVIDTGVQPISDLSSTLLFGADFSDTSGTSVGDGRIDIDTFGHGTGEASLIGGSTSSLAGVSGLAPEASVLPIRVTDGTSARLVFGIAPGIEYAISRGSRVINLALANSLEDSEIRSAVEDAVAHDVVVVAAVGNDGTSQQFYPAAWPGVVGVGAIDSSGKVWAKSNTGADVDLVAPGVHILRDDNRGRVGYSDGTSEATAYVSAAAALVRSAHPGWSAAEVVAALVGTADKPEEMRGAVRDDRYGAGILNVLAAVSLARPPEVGGEPARTVGGGGRAVWWWVAGGVGLVGGAAVVVFGVLRRRRRA